MAFEIVILAAGLGKRMYSQLPKVLHRLAGKPLLEHVINTSEKLAANSPPIVIYGHEGATVQQALEHLSIRWVSQTQQLGTGHALQQALPQLSASHVLVLYGDVPLISEHTLKQLLESTPQNAIGILTAELPNPTGFGRIIRDAAGNMINIVEEKDASGAQRKIHEVNSGIYFIPTTLLHVWLPTLENNNAQKEYYLTDIIAFAVKENIAIHSIQPAAYQEILGINDRQQLADLERYYQHQYAQKLLKQGVTLYDPARFDIRGELTIGQDVTIDINVILEGSVTIGNHCVIGPNTILRNVIINDYVEIRANSVIDGAEIADHCTVGPFARIRPNTVLASHTHIGNFVEIKNSSTGNNTKINHLSYIGDSEIGKHVNVGAGVITCNYDGANKHLTIIGDYAFIGSSTQLVAPISIGEQATIGAGSTITRNAPANQLTVCRMEQRSIKNWQRPKKEEK